VAAIAFAFHQFLPACAFPVLVLVESEHYINILTERRSVRHAHALPSLPLPADQRHAARARESRRLLAAVATACIFDSIATSGESSSLDNFCPQNQTHMLDIALHACFLGVVVACRINCPQKLEKFGASAQGFSNRRRRPVAAARLVLLNFFSTTQLHVLDSCGLWKCGLWMATTFSVERIIS